MRRVSTLGNLDYFGESSLIDERQKRNATVTVGSEVVQLLHLEKAEFEELMGSGDIGTDAIEHGTDYNILLIHTIIH